MSRFGYNTSNPHPDYETLKPLIGNAFKTLRRRGLIARQNFMCCSSCAGYDLATRIEKMKAEKRKKVMGMVYYCTQSETSFKEHGDLYLQYSDRSTNKRPDDIPMTTKEVGNLICDVFKEVGVPFEWSGKESQCIHVVNPENEKARDNK